MISATLGPVFQDDDHKHRESFQSSWNHTFIPLSACLNTVMNVF